MTNTKHILVTGGAGYIGSVCVRQFLDEGHSVVVFDNLEKGTKDAIDQRALFVEGDVRNRDMVNTLFQEHSFDVVVHMAGRKSIEESEKEPSKYIYTNIVGAINVFCASERRGVGHVLFSSSATVYKPKEDGVYSEESECDPATVYGITKHTGENVLRMHSRLGKIPKVTIFRFFNVAGYQSFSHAEDEAPNLLPAIAIGIKEGKKPKIFGDAHLTEDGTGVRDYIHVADISKAHALAIEKEISGTYNLGTEKGYSVKDVINMFSEVLGVEVVYDVFPAREGDQAVATADASAFMGVSGWKPTKTLKEMVQSTVTAYGL